MNWTRIVLGGVVAGIVTNLVGFVMHGILLADTYKRYSEVFTQTEANPAKFFAVSIALSLGVAILFARTRPSWAAGWKGGATFGLFFGCAQLFVNFYNPLVIAGFPYYLGWCWGGIEVILGVVRGAVLGALIPRQ
ncbi:MAG: hypothetical protein KBF21_20395 [Thermoanaerobaculia bacterium]|jgi:hypothetical protein|nr:hypothetical protein [Thermoanaerobaculia bacterium]